VTPLAMASERVRRRTSEANSSRVEIARFQGVLACVGAGQREEVFDNVREAMRFIAQNCERLAVFLGRAIGGGIG